MCVWFVYRTIFKYRRYSSIIAFVITVGNNILHRVLAVVTVVTAILRTNYFIS